jgi:hypothetical protein
VRDTLDEIISVSYFRCLKFARQLTADINDSSRC